MPTFRYHLDEDARPEDFPLRSFNLNLEMELDFGDIEVPEAAARRIAKQLLARIEPSPGRAPAAPAPSHDPNDWVQPAGIDMRILKSAHRVVKEVARRGESGKAVLASELVQEGLVSAPTMSRLLRDDETAGQYLAPYILVAPAGRTKSIDLTAKGRLLASKIRAGVVPS